MNLRRLSTVFLLLGLTAVSYSQSKLIRGLIVDPDGDPLTGVNVVQKNTTNGVITNFDGRYVIQNIAEGDTLVYSFIGFETAERIVGSSNEIDVMLDDAASLLGEVQVVAFSKQRKESVIGSITTIRPAELKQPASNLTAALAGRMAGIVSYQRSGEPGRDNAEFFIRGVTSFGYANSPLILLDGFEISSEDLARIEPDNIASFSIMKDATSTALYGARGANGVILVNTKEGREGRARITARVETSISSPTKMNSFLSGVDYMELYNKALRTRVPEAQLFYSKDKIENTRNGVNPYIYPSVDWYDELFKSHTYNRRANLNVTGGGAVAQYYVSASFNNETGLLKVDNHNNFNNNIDINRYNLRANVNINLSKTTKLSTKLYSLFTQYDGPSENASNIFRSVMNANPVTFPKYFPRGTNVLIGSSSTEFVNHTMFGNRSRGGGQFYPNPYADMVKGYRDEFSSTILSQFQIEQDLSVITQGLSARGMAAIRNYSSYGSSRSFQPFYYDGLSYLPSTPQDPEGTIIIQQLNEGTEYLADPTTWTNANSRVYFELATIYDHDFGKHSVGGLLVFTQEERLNTIQGSNNIYTSLPARNMGLAGRTTYGFDNKYFVELNFGYNGSERFAKDNRFGFFPSAGVAYTISEENFWAQLKPTISQLKLKATYGLVGNDAISAESDRFFYMSNVNINSGGRGYAWGQDFSTWYNGYNIHRYANESVTWEIAEKLNLGLEMTLFDRLTIQGDYFRENRTNIYMPYEYIPATSGLAATIRSNIGEAFSHGFDGSVDYNHSFFNGLYLIGRANFTYATNEIVANGEPQYPYDYMSRVGQPINQIWGLVAERLFIDEADIQNSPVQTFGTNYLPGDIKYVDINNDGRIDENDRVPIGFPTVPEIIYGFGITAGYKGIDASFFFQGSARSSFMIAPDGIAPFVNERNALNIIADNHWSDFNPDPYAFWPRLSTTPIENNEQPSTWWLRDGSFLRLKSFEVGYTLNQSALQRLSVDNLRLYLSGNNLFYFSKFKEWDPEMGSNGLGYPTQRIFNIGMNVTF
ncbi:SusC/RagA family TonB-linked outer membrane protein [Alkalitalea saponilacus]|uniref:TonB-linked outer membrane protein, SusC/RagA family n=1 Tax=Alkalitalea saponilacus TaxID=889453 RepID=A0A1T5AYD0_9BACT|nr:TonB-dependent receptor [Alkalitalea saponilacus]ASB48553.1 SusC/RagA family TonB-linked outer membrane protein [Alkalitalea saponilacus]SKB39976.1 TonB-linked outer membrane protein, SusC/RagA family [Alkalitalea saponilacus]